MDPINTKTVFKIDTGLINSKTDSTYGIRICANTSINILCLRIVERCRDGCEACHDFNIFRRKKLFLSLKNMNMFFKGVL